MALRRAFALVHPSVCTSSTSLFRSFAFKRHAGGVSYVADRPPVGGQSVPLLLLLQRQ